MEEKGLHPDLRHIDLKSLENLTVRCSLEPKRNNVPNISSYAVRLSRRIAFH